MATNLSKPVATEQHFRYLDSLRESGETNMYGAGPYLQRRFGVDRHAAKAILLKWMAHVSAQGDTDGN